MMIDEDRTGIGPQASLDQTRKRILMKNCIAHREECHRRVGQNEQEHRRSN